jgi:hypothetical protein
MVIALVIAAGPEGEDEDIADHIDIAERVAVECCKRWGHDNVRDVPGGCHVLAACARCGAST